MVINKIQQWNKRRASTAATCDFEYFGEVGSGIPIRTRYQPCNILIGQGDLERDRRKSRTGVGPRKDTVHIFECCGMIGGKGGVQKDFREVVNITVGKVGLKWSSSRRGLGRMRACDRRGREGGRVGGKRPLCHHVWQGFAYVVSVHQNLVI
jgi:hypothetical protein